jgi:hypothetical protein
MALAKTASGPRGRTRVTDDAFTRVKIDQLLKDTECKLTAACSVRFERPLDDTGKAEYAPDSRRRARGAMSEAKSQERDRQSDTRQHRPEGATLKELARSHNVRAATNSGLAA